jgi:hypothetical protein
MTWRANREDAIMKRITWLLIVFLPLILINSAQAGLTHLGQPQWEHVTLKQSYDASNLCGNDRGFFRVWADGREATKVYNVPSGKMLIITDVIWEVTPLPTAFSQGRTVHVGLNAHKMDGTFVGEVFRSTAVITTADHLLGKRLSGSDQILAGVRIGPYRRLCTYADSLSSTGGARNTVTSAWIHGYQIPK